MIMISIAFENDTQQLLKSKKYEYSKILKKCNMSFEFYNINIQEYDEQESGLIEHDVILRSFNRISESIADEDFFLFALVSTPIPVDELNYVLKNIKSIKCYDEAGIVVWRNNYYKEISKKYFSN